MRVRFVTPSLPWPPDQGARIRSAALIRALPDDVELDLWYVARPEEPGLPDALLDRCRDVRRFERSETSLVERWALPRPARWFHSHELRNALAAEADDIDIVHLDEPSLATLWPESTTQRVCLCHHKIESDLSYALASATSGMRAARHLLDSARWERVESDAAERIPFHVTCSALDAHRLRARFPALETVVVENGVDPERFAPLHRERDVNRILFLGSLDYGPNQDGLRAFLSSVWPDLRAQLPDLRLAVVGRGEAHDLQAASSFDARVDWVGEVDDPRERIARCGAFIVPLSIGGGTRIKLVEALAMQTPVISTPIGAEGLDLTSGVHLRIAELGPAFARAIVDALNTPQPDPIAVAGCARVAELYDWRVLAERLAGAWRAWNARG